MNRDFKMALLRANYLVIMGMIGFVIVMLIVELVRRHREQNHAELDLHDAMGTFIYFINDDDDIDREILTGIRIEDDWNERIAFFHEVPKDHRKRFIITTASCWEFDLEAFGKEWFLTEDKAKAFKKAKKSANR
ncbi:hypothetical protein [[Clostridium] innocuum]|uniref:hypothetical protein n=1 Tax=Clostridium innocuum TaxID=1522 RepID=UPI003A4D7A85